MSELSKLLEARSVLAGLAGTLKALKGEFSPDGPLQTLLQSRIDEIEAVLARPLFDDVEKAA